jgi:probable F420-dependent oxidoreductase
VQKNGPDGLSIGVVFPQTEIGTDTETIAEYARVADDLGFDHLLAYEHVLGVDPGANPDWNGSFDYDDTFHDPLTLYSHLAAVTEEITFVTGVLVLPQRQTALVAKQAAQLDLLSGGRLRLGVANGWNEPEYVAMGADFDSRADRIEEQIRVLRRLWTEESVEFEGEYHSLPGVGIRPGPAQERVPVWLGGMAPAVLDRVARVGDGWIPELDPGDRAEVFFDRLGNRLRAHDRDPADVGVQARLKVDPGDPEAWIAGVEFWGDLGAEYVAINPLYNGLSGTEHTDFLATVGEELSAAGLL